MAQDPVLEGLFMEYREMRQEFRDLINSMNTNLQLSMVAVTAAVGWGVSNDRRVLYTVPTVLFAFTMVHLLKTTVANILGAYCQVLAAKMRRQMNADDRVFDWEGGLLWQHVSQPTSIVQVGFYLFFLFVISLFLFFSWRAYIAYRWTGLVHGAEIVTVLSYAIAAVRWNQRNGRQLWLKRYGLLGGVEAR